MQACGLRAAAADGSNERASEPAQKQCAFAARESDGWRKDAEN
jgi:hypothetical protein